MTTMCKPTGRTFGDIKRSGRLYFETIRLGSLLRFYEHENGGWSVRIHNIGIGIIHCPTKQETWSEAIRVAKAHAEEPDHNRSHYTDADILRNGGTPNVLCRNGAPI